MEYDRPRVGDTAPPLLDDESSLGVDTSEETQPDNSFLTGQMPEVEEDGGGLPPTLALTEQALDGGEEGGGGGEGGEEVGPYEVDESTFTQSDVYKVKVRWIQAAIEIVKGHVEYVYGQKDEMYEDYMNDSGFQTLLDDLEGRKQTTLEEMDESGEETLIHEKGGIGLSKYHMRGVYSGKRLHWRGRIMDPKYPDQLTSLIATGLGLKWGVARTLLKDGFIQSLNSDAWVPIVKEMTFDNGKSYESSFIPINTHFDEENFGEYGETGNSSMSPRISTTDDDPHKELEDRTTNMWLSQYKNEEGKVLFEAFRSGTLAYTFSDLDPDRQQEIAQNKAYDLLKAVVVQHITQKLTPAQRIDAINGNFPVHIDFASINLQTPGTFSFLGAESRHVKDEWEALTAFQGLQTFDLVFGGEPRQVQVDLNIIALDFGVNSARNVRGLDRPAGKNQHKVNKNEEHGIPALERLVQEYVEATGRTMGVYETQLTDSPEDPQVPDWQKGLDDEQDRLGKVQELWRQIKKSWKSGGTLYEVPARVANLMFLMGKAVHFNCKSGKDRTGFMDVESKFLAQQIEEKGYVPKYKNKLKGEDKKEHRKLLFESGNLEVQEKNTGAKGYKIAPMRVAESAMWERVGKDLNLAQGLGDLTTVDLDYDDPKKKPKPPKN